MTDKRFLLMRLDREGDYWHTVMNRFPLGLFATEKEAHEAGNLLKNKEFEIWELKEDGSFDEVW